jgi:putative copper export protein
MLQPFFQWMNDHAVSKAIGESIWIYPLVQAIHLLFLALFAGALLIVDLRLMGWGMRDQPVARVARDAWPWMIIGLVGLVVTGMPQLMQNAMREYYSDFFWMKMYVLPVALIYTFTIRQRVALADEARVAPAMSKLTGLASILLWIGGVAVPSRLIGLFT